MNQGKTLIQKVRQLTVILVMAGLLLTSSPALMAAGIPPLPAIYSGQVVTNGGTPISAGILRAYIEGTLCSIPFQFTGGTFSSFPVGPKESAWSGKLVTFTVDVGGVEYPASSTPSIYWRSQEEIEGIVIITGAPAPVAVTGITLSPGNLNLIAGGGFSLLTATILPADASNKAVTWSSSNPGVATVSNGMVTPLAPGNTIISVTTADGGYSASCAVTVISNQVPVTGIVLSASSLSLVQGERS